MRSRSKSVNGKFKYKDIFSCLVIGLGAFLITYSVSYHFINDKTDKLSNENEKASDDNNTESVDSSIINDDKNENTNNNINNDTNKVDSSSNNNDKGSINKNSNSSDKSDNSNTNKDYVNVSFSSNGNASDINNLSTNVIINSNISNYSIYYGWSNSNTTQPNYTGTITNNGIVTCPFYQPGIYYLWIKVTYGDKNVIITSGAFKKLLFDRNVLDGYIEQDSSRLLYYYNNKKWSFVEANCTNGNLMRKTSSCGNFYTKSESDYITNVLYSDVNNAGFKSRAGVVAAARFLAIKFPYRIVYYWRGKYESRGLNLINKGYNNVTNDSKPNANLISWGFPMEMKNNNTRYNNGLNCMGFIGWAFINGGYPLGYKNVFKDEISTEVTKYVPSNDIVSIENSYNYKYNNIKVGDILYGADDEVHHVGMVIGKTNDYLYVAQSAGSSYTRNGVQLFNGVGIETFKIGSSLESDELYQTKKQTKHFTVFIKMDSFYGNDGNYSLMW